jgi:hypothetical protein
MNCLRTALITVGSHCGGDIDLPPQNEEERESKDTPDFPLQKPTGEPPTQQQVVERGRSPYFVR